MEQHNLQAASTYINNLLLARGLLKNGKPIDFAAPENGSGGTDETMARIINLVNDLVVRRDREAEHRENLATTIRVLRANESQQALEIERLKTKTSELKRSLALAEGQERAFKTNINHAEATIRNLKEQVQRMKTTIQQVRAQCANDVRKRDVEMQKLKSHLNDRQRGKREGLGVTTINTNPGSERNSRIKVPAAGDSINNPGYSLKQETNEFLTELCQNLSDENDTLIALARNTIKTLKDLQGLSTVEDGRESCSVFTAAGSQRSSHGPITALPTSCDELTTEMDEVLEHLRTLLTNPSFVPLEEVEIRDEEIMRLREGWEKMEGRWKQAVAMMDGWHKRISDGGDSIQADELRMGMGLGLTTCSTNQQSAEDAAETNEHCQIYEDEPQDDEDEEASGEEEQDDHPPADLNAVMTKRSVLKAQSNALGERSGNIGAARSPRKVSFPDDLVENSRKADGDEDETLQVKAHRSETVTQRPSRKKADSKIPRQATKGPRLSVPEKLAAVEAEAKAAQEARKQDEGRKRSRTGKVSSKKKYERRRSTLTSDELDELMGVPSA
ncbi:hypothetical protein VTN00DRAFT_3656 [Thermoascus crustaceus]|uniref:uncharacterized protein n=1 Tax=Thermoascus crustaceus TaxID=5088 RepID=UPI003742AB17